MFQKGQTHGLQAGSLCCPWLRFLFSHFRLHLSDHLVYLGLVEQLFQILPVSWFDLCLMK